jgi:hypothetical protein
MAKRPRLSLLRATLVTPALTAGTGPTSAMVPSTNVQQVNGVIDPVFAAAEARLKAAILALTPAARLRIAGARVSLPYERDIGVRSHDREWERIVRSDCQKCTCNGWNAYECCPGPPAAPPKNENAASPPRRAPTGTVRPKKPLGNKEPAPAPKKSPAPTPQNPS